MKIIIDDNIKLKTCPNCYTQFMYNVNEDSYEVFGRKGCADTVRMVECPKCHKSSEEQYLTTLKLILDEAEVYF